MTARSRVPLFPTPPKSKPYATSIPGRAPEVKVYDTWGRAKASIACKSRCVKAEPIDGKWVATYSYPDAAVYEWDGSKWVEIYRVYDGDTTLPWEDK